MKRLLSVLAFALVAAQPSLRAQALSNHWEDLTAPDFVKAIEQSKGTCLLPFGIIEKHGPSGPLGTDLLNARYIAELATKQEYTIVFPPYYFGQIAEARSQPGTLSYPRALQLEMLEATVEEMSRNGCKKIMIQNGHGGNTLMLQYFSQTQLEKRHDYAIYVIALNAGSSDDMPAAAKPSGPGADGHAGESEVSNIMAHTPQDAHPERGGTQSFTDQKRLQLPKGVYMGLTWYASYPNHYAGDASKSSVARGKALTEYSAKNLANIIKAIKADNDALRLQTEFSDKADHPLNTKQ